MKKKYLLSPKSVLLLFLIFVISIILLNVFKQDIHRKYLSLINFFYVIPLILLFIFIGTKNLKIANSKNEKLFTIIPLAIICIFILLFIIRIIYILLIIHTPASASIMLVLIITKAIADQQWLFYIGLENGYIHQYKDHLGNTRVSFRKDRAGVLEVTDTSNYYPFVLGHISYIMMRCSD